MLALRRGLPTLSRQHARRIVAVWTVSLPFSTILSMVLWAALEENGLKLDDYFAGVLGLLVAGALGGYYLAQVWTREQSHLSGQAQLQIAGAWAASFGLSYVMLKLILLPILGPGLMGWALAGLIAGGLGGAATLWVFTRPAAPTMA